ncbi:MAG: hypothetical protein JKY58_01550 [Pseudomonas sp.]|nr:hypothetical protein [Pseudomonas sp.]
MTIETMHFMSASKLVTKNSPLYRPSSFPPAKEWIVSVDNQGAALSLYGEDFWDFRAFERSVTFNFKTVSSSTENRNLIKKIIHLVIYHPRLFPGKIRSCVYIFNCLKKIAKVCDRAKILISEIQRFPALHKEVSDAFQGSFYKIYISFLHKLRPHADILGFEIFGERALVFLASQQNDHETVQTPYIPPRIWSYALNRMSECLDDFLEHQEALETAFDWLANAYNHNASFSQERIHCSPFTMRDLHSRRITFPSGFEAFLVEHELNRLFVKWLGEPKAQNKISRFSAYFNMVKQASLFYIMSFSLQRVSEAVSLRSDCFLLERDARLGDIAMVVGETTKTDPDSDARWVVPISAKRAVDVATKVARWRLKHFSNDESDPVYDGSVPLSLAAKEPWATVTGNNRNSKNELISQLKLRTFMDQFPKFFDPNTLLVTEEDWKAAVSITPNLGNKKGFRIGSPWPFSAHQLRRTTNVNMFASNMVSDNSLQWQMKHLTQQMTLYYGRNYINLRLNSDAETAVVVESYNAIYRQLTNVIQDSVENVRPHFIETIPMKVVNLVSAGEEKKLIKLIAEGEVGCRRTLAGFCMKAGACKYGGIESIAQCAGSDGGGICSDAIFKREKEPGLRHLKTVLEKEIESLNVESPRFSALKKEIYAIEVYLSVIKN